MPFGQLIQQFTSGFLKKPRSPIGELHEIFQRVEFHWNVNVELREALTPVGILGAGWAIARQGECQFVSREISLDTPSWEVTVSDKTLSLVNAYTPSALPSSPQSESSSMCARGSNACDSPLGLIRVSCAWSVCHAWRLIRTTSLVRDGSYIHRGACCGICKVHNRVNCGGSP